MNVSATKILNQLNQREIFSSKYDYYNNCAIHDYGGMILQNNETYDPQCTNGKIMMTTTIITDRLGMYCSINMYKMKQLYQYEHKTLPYRFYEKNCLNNKECDSKLKTVV